MLQHQKSSFFSRHYLVLIISCLIALAVLIVLKSYVFKTPANTPPKPKKVDVIKVKEETLVDHLSFPTTLKPGRSTTIKSEFQGLITKINVPLGQKVKKGQTLLFIKRLDPLFQGLPAQIQSDMDGIVAHIEAKEGNHVALGELLITIIDETRLTINLQVAPEDLKFLTIGQEGHFVSQDKTQNLPIKITGKSSFISTETGTAPLEVSFISKENGLLPGQFGYVVFDINQRKSFLVPEESVHYHGKEIYLYRVQNGEIHKFLFQNVQFYQNKIEVTGLHEGDLIITTNDLFLKEGEKVEYHVK